jgi:hypothetical protein
MPVRRRRTIEIVSLNDLDQQEPGGILFRIAHGVCRSQVVVMLGKRRDQSFRDLGCTGNADDTVVVPPKHLAEEGQRIVHSCVVFIVNQLGESRLDFDRAMTIDDNAMLDEHSWRDHEPDLADLAKPLPMGEKFGRNGCH